MLVYSDPLFQESLRSLLRRLRDRIEGARQGDLDAPRAFLIKAGQLEQAAQDHWPVPEAHIEDLLVRIQTLTDHAAAAFYSVWVDAGGGGGGGGVGGGDSLASLAK